MPAKYTHIEGDLGGGIMTDTSKTSKNGSTLTDKLHEAVGVARGVMDGVMDDAQVGWEAMQGRIGDVVEKLSTHETFKPLYDIVSGAATRGYEATRDAVVSYHERFDAKLNQEVQDHPELVGFVDGVIWAYAAQEANRRPRSKAYKTHVGYGKVFGGASSVALTLSGRSLAMVVGAVPWITHGGKYIAKKVDEARAATAASPTA